MLPSAALKNRFAAGLSAELVVQQVDATGNRSSRSFPIPHKDPACWGTIPRQSSNCAKFRRPDILDHIGIPCNIHDAHSVHGVHDAHGAHGAHGARDVRDVRGVRGVRDVRDVRGVLHGHVARWLAEFPRQQILMQLPSQQSTNI